MCAGQEYTRKMAWVAGKFCNEEGGVTMTRASSIEPTPLNDFWNIPNSMRAELAVNARDILPLQRLVAIVSK